MKLLLVRHLWGVDLSRGLSPYVARWRETGYQALEAPLGTAPAADLLRRTLRQERFGWIPQVFTNMFEPGGTVARHLESLRAQIEECLPEAPLFFNCHSGSDAWSEAEAEDFYGAALELEASIGVPLAHETHRSRYFANPWATDRMLRRFPALKLTCDYSHWVCVAERLLPDCKEILDRSARQCWHVHARVGYEEGPQVPDPRVPEWSTHLAAHESWWDAIWQAQARGGQPLSTLTPEFGPPPYLHTIPGSGEPVADLNAVCDWMAERQRRRFEQQFGQQH